MNMFALIVWVSFKGLPNSSNMLLLIYNLPGEPYTDLSLPLSLRAPRRLDGPTRTTLHSVSPAWTLSRAGLASCLSFILSCVWIPSSSKTRSLSYARIQRYWEVVRGNLSETPLNSSEHPLWDLQCSVRLDSLEARYKYNIFHLQNTL